jgi:hypothetical protein
MGLVLFSSAYANEFKRIGTCGSALVISGDACSNVKVQFQFDGCEHKSEPQLAKRVICDRDTIKARFQEGNLRYEAPFEKTDDGWGGVTWKPLGGVTQYKKINTFAQSKPSTPVIERTVAEIPASSQVSQAVTAATTPNSPFRFGGFADLRYTNFSIKDNPLVASGHPESGFGLEDGAFYGNYDKDNLSVFLDVTFRRIKDADINPAATKPNQSSNGNFAIGYDKSQLYLKYKLDSMFVVDFGQFDTIYGVELNDSKDRIFGKTGIVYDYTLPVTHTGIMVEFLSNGFYAKTFAANPNNKGSFGSSASGDDNTEYGAALGFNNELIRSQVGYLVRPVNKASGSGSGNRSLLDVILGTTLNSFSLDVEYCQVTDPSKNTLTAGDATDDENPGNGILALATYKFTDAFLIGARYEMVNDDPAAINVKSTTAIGGSINYRLSPELGFRTEYISYDSKGVNDAKWKDSRFNVAALLTF